MIETFSSGKRNYVLKSLIVLSKFCGFYPEFRQRMKDYGIKWHRSSSIDSFFRIMNSTSNDVLEWYDNALNALHDNDLSMYLEFAIMSGMRASEAIMSFNLMIDLDAKDKFNEYYNEELQTVEHFNIQLYSLGELRMSSFQ